MVIVTLEKGYISRAPWLKAAVKVKMTMKMFLILTCRLVTLKFHMAAVVKSKNWKMRF